jgi:regulator of replication initiation timing
MSYIDNKSSLIKEIQILEMENEMLRNQIKKLKLEKNELLDNAQLKAREIKDGNTNSRVRRNYSNDSGLL